MTETPKEIELAASDSSVSEFDFNSNGCDYKV